MIHSPSRKKKCEFQIDKQNYLRHLDRLAQLKDGRGPDQLKFHSERKRLNEAIVNLRKMHSNNRNFRSKESKEVQKETNMDKYGRIHSVIKKQIAKPALQVAKKHKHSSRVIDEENCKMFDRLVHVKSHFDFHSEVSQEKPLNTLPHLHQIDFSQLYNTSRFKEAKTRQFSFVFGKGKDRTLFRLSINAEELAGVLKDYKSLYVFECSCNGRFIRSRNFIPCDYQYLNLRVRMPNKTEKVVVKIFKVLDNKELFKGCLEVCTTEILERPEYFDLEKTLRSSNGRPEAKLKVKFQVEPEVIFINETLSPHELMKSHQE